MERSRHLDRDSKRIPNLTISITERGIHHTCLQIDRRPDAKDFEANATDTKRGELPWVVPDLECGDRMASRHSELFKMVTDLGETEGYDRDSGIQPCKVLCGHPKHFLYATSFSWPFR